MQRPLWASTSTKNPAYPDLLYVDSLIGPDTVNTMPDATVAAFKDHGTVARTVDQGVDAGPGRPRRPARGRHRHGRRVAPAGRRGRGLLLQELRRAAAGARRQGERTHKASGLSRDATHALPRERPGGRPRHGPPRPSRRAGRLRRVRRPDPPQAVAGAGTPVAPAPAARGFRHDRNGPDRDVATTASGTS